MPYSLDFPSHSKTLAHLLDVMKKPSIEVTSELIILYYEKRSEESARYKKKWGGGKTHPRQAISILKKLEKHTLGGSLKYGFCNGHLWANFCILEQRWHFIL